MKSVSSSEDFNFLDECSSNNIFTTERRSDTQYSVDDEEMV